MNIHPADTVTLCSPLLIPGERLKKLGGQPNVWLETNLARVPAHVTECLITQICHYQDAYCKEPPDSINVCRTCNGFGYFFMVDARKLP